MDHGSTREKEAHQIFYFCPYHTCPAVGEGEMWPNQNHAKGDTDSFVARVGVVLCPWL
jgi:hypothetical protein